MKEIKTSNGIPKYGEYDAFTDFDTVTDRSGTNSLKWDDSRPDELPLWVADMDFRTCPAITEAIMERAAHGIYGYSIIPAEWNEAYRKWWSDRHGYTPSAESLVFCTGVVPALSSIVRKLTTPAEKVLIMTPVYNIFFNCILNQGRFVKEFPLECRNSSYFIDFEKLEEYLSDPQCTMMFLCNPHNPVGRIWTAEELERIGSLCHRYGVIVVSDEIHCDLTRPGTEYVPFASINEECAQNSITCWSPGKSFNMAGLNSAAVMIPNPSLRYRAERGLNTDECAEPNAFAIQATVAAYTWGNDWFEKLRTYLFANADHARSRILAEIPEVGVTPMNATYLMWLDVSAITSDSRILTDFLRSAYGLRVSDGCQFGTGGEKFIRLNVACPRIILDRALDRFVEGCLNFKQRH